MTNDFIKNIGVKSTTQSTYGQDAASKASTTKKNSLTGAPEMGQQEFLTLLVNQLQQQDPLNPMDSQQFSAQLATFSQLEQLIGINKKMENLAGSSASSMASFLGHEIVFKDQNAVIANGSGPNVLLDVPEGANSGRIDFINENGQVAGSYQIDKLESGKQVIKLSGVNVEDGSYTLRAVTVTSQGKFQNLDAKVTGTVDGFVMEPDAALVVNGESIAMDQIAEVTMVDKK
ncbi:MAG: hypothetical protein IT292_09495 [Deltaproteobacteria bacterium]|nr:hypothetical protein [Deltaproteobacteria bacterium]